MTLRAWNVVLAVALAGSIWLNWVWRPDPAEPNLEVLPDMVRTARYNAYSANPVFDDGKTLQAPPEGTIARGRMPLHYGTTPREAFRAGQELQNPFTPEPAHLQRGEQVYRSFCAPCHGAGGQGDGPVSQRGMPPPPTLLGRRAQVMPDGRYFHIITYGGRIMASYAAQIQPDDRWKAILYIRQMQEAAAATQAVGPAPAAPDAAAAPTPGG